MQKLTRHGLCGDPRPPEGLILGIDAGESLDSNWSVFTDADDKFLKGTDSDAVVTTTGSRTAISYTSGSGGSHSSGTNQYVDYGYSGTGGSSMNPSRDSDSVESHTHVVSVTHVPPSLDLKLVQAGSGAKFFTGLIGFATSALSDQTLFATFNGESGYLKAATATDVSAKSTSLGIGNTSDSHDHIKSELLTCSGVANCYDSASSGGGTHDHSDSASILVSPYLKKALVRAYKIADEKKITGLIGMWIGSGVPDGWELVTALNDHYVGCYDSGDGTEYGDNTVDVSGVTANSGHSHSFSGDAGYHVCTAIPHSSTVNHTHSISKSSISYQPDRYHVKFIRYVG